MTWATGVYTIWSVIAVDALVLWWLTATGRTVAGRRVAHPGALVAALLRHPVLRLVVVVGWMWIGWHFFAR